MLVQQWTCGLKRMTKICDNLLIVRSIINFLFFRTITATSEVAGKETEQLKPWTEMPGPTVLPVIGSVLLFMPRGRYEDFE